MKKLPSLLLLCALTSLIRAEDAAQKKAPAWTLISSADRAKSPSDCSAMCRYASFPVMSESFSRSVMARAGRRRKEKRDMAERERRELRNAGRMAQPLVVIFLTRRAVTVCISLTAAGVMFSPPLSMSSRRRARPLAISLSLAGFFALLSISSRASLK